LEQLSALLDARAILSLPSTSDPLIALDDKCFALSYFLMFALALRLELTLVCVVVARFVGIMGDFPWRLLMKQVKPTGGTVSLSAAAPAEGGQSTIEVGPVVVGTAEIAPNALSSVLVKRKQDDSVGPSSRKKSRAPLSLRALRQVIRLTPDVGCHSSVQDVPSASPIVEASIVVDVVIVTPVPPPLSVVLVREATLIVAEESAPVSLASFVVASLSTVAAPLLSVSVVTTNALVVPSSSSSTHMVPPPTTLASTYTSSHPRVSLNHIYTSNDDDSLWGMGYKHK